MTVDFVCFELAERRLFSFQAWGSPRRTNALTIVMDTTLEDLCTLFRICDSLWGTGRAHASDVVQREAQVPKDPGGPAGGSVCPAVYTR